MKSIQEQIEALTQELRPYPEGQKFYTFDEFDPESDLVALHLPEEKWREHNTTAWKYSLYASTNKAEVEEYADCYRRLKLYQLLGKKAEKEFPFVSGNKFGFNMVGYCERFDYFGCIFGGVWFSREKDRLEALKICGITKEFQEKCAKYGLGGA